MYFSLIFVPGIRPALNCFSLLACHQLGSSLLKIARMSPFSKARPASTHGNSISSEGSYENKALTYVTVYIDV